MVKGIIVVNLSHVKAGFELEFSHDWSFKDIRGDLQSLFPNDPWVPYYFRKKTVRYFSLTSDASIALNFDGERAVELVTPVWPLSRSYAKLWKIFEWMKESGANTNYSTGFHINLSIPRMHIDPLLLVKYTNDKLWLRKFHRLYNVYCVPQGRTKKGLKICEKFKSINFSHQNYIEFRIVGGADYHLHRNKVFAAINHFAKSLVRSSL